MRAHTSRVYRLAIVERVDLEAVLGHHCFEVLGLGVGWREPHGQLGVPREARVLDVVLERKAVAGDGLLDVVVDGELVDDGDGGGLGLLEIEDRGDVLPPYLIAGKKHVAPSLRREN